MGKPRKKRPTRPNATGRSNKTARFTMLFHAMLMSNAFRACSPNARALLIELAMLENGENNGSLYMSVRDAAARMGVVDLVAASKAFDELQERGLIAMTKEAHFSVKASEHCRARCWRLTWLRCDKRAPTHDYLEVGSEPAPGTRERKRMENGAKALKAYRKSRDADKMPVVDSETMVGFEAKTQVGAVLNSDTPNTQNGGKAPNPVVRDSTTYSYATKGSATVHVPSIGWWAPDWSHVAAMTAYAAVLASQRAMGPQKRRMTPSKNRAALQKPANPKIFGASPMVAGAGL